MTNVVQVPVQSDEDYDLAARKVVMSAYLYYRRAAPVLSDGDYDALTRYVADGWPKLSPCRQWQLESKAALLATGSHCKVTRAAEGGALAWHTSVFGCEPEGFMIAKWKHSKRHNVDWVAAEC